MYDSSDPRSSLAPAAKAPVSAVIAPAQYGLFYKDPPRENGPDGCSWYTRGQNFLVGYSEAATGGVFARENQPDEYVVLLPEKGSGATIEWNGTRADVAGFSISFVPAGASRVVMRDAGPLVRIFTTDAPDLVERCSNATAYQPPRANVAPVEPWPAPRGGEKIRTYSLDVPAQPGRFGRIFRGRTLMINFLEPRQGQRDPTKMSPHHHEDFEQGSLALAGAFTHFIRWPWGTDMNAWRADEAETCPAPSLCVIPPPAIHTSQSVDPGHNQLVDIFCPPRLDFSSKPGWILNADDYPMPNA